MDCVGNEEDIALSDCKELLVAVLNDEIELVLVPVELCVS